MTTKAELIKALEGLPDDGGRELRKTYTDNI